VLQQRRREPVWVCRMHDSTMRDARGIGRFKSLLEWCRVIGNKGPARRETEGAPRCRKMEAGTAERLRITCSQCAKIIVAFVVLGKRAAQDPGC
jgi:hypothetical protein